MLPDFKGLLEGEITWGSRCSFCNGLEEATGELTVPIGPDDSIDVPIGPNCLEGIKKAGAKVLDKSDESVLE
jgi:hypothetical protein